jgi:hypothetical protein
MSLDKAIKHGKEKRVEYRRSLAFDRSCRNHGRCSYCESNRTIQAQREMGRLKGQEDEFWNEHSLPDPDDATCQACNEAEHFCNDCSGLVE